MNDEDRKFLQSIKNMSPNSEVFQRLVKILKVEQEKSDQLLKDSLSENA